MPQLDSRIDAYIRKGEDTRNRRVTQAVAWIAEGKSRNWKYQ